MTTDDTTQQLPPESPQPRRLLRARSDRVIGGVCGGLGRYFNLDPIIFRIGAVVLAFVGGAGLLAYLAALLLIPSEDSPAAADAPPGRNRWLVIAGVIVLLLVAWPFLLGGGLLLAGLLVPFALLVAAGVLVWWFVSGEGPGGDAGRHRQARRPRHRDHLPLRTDRASAAPGRRPRAARPSWRSP